MLYDSEMNRIITLLVLLFSAAAWAIPTPLKAIEELKKVHLEQGRELAYRVKSARVVLADYKLIQRDFPATRALSHEEIDAWLLQYAGLIAESQARLGKTAGTNTFIRVDRAQQITAYRPEQYGRGLVFEMGPPGSGTEPGAESTAGSGAAAGSTVGSGVGLGGGLIDAKGAGALKPRPGSHSTGLATLGEAIQGYAVEKLVKSIFSHSQSGFDTIESYAVLNMGFSAYTYDEEVVRKVPAGVLLRQAHNRFNARSVYQLDDEVALSVEKVLRHYGMTSAGADHMNAPDFDKSQNIQGAVQISAQGSKAIAVVDFGTYMALEKFSNGLLGMDRTPRRLVYLLDPGSEDFIQPDPRLAVATQFWGIESEEIHLANGAMKTQWVDRLADWTSSWAEKLSRDQGPRVRAELVEFLDTLYARETTRWTEYDQKLLKPVTRKRKRSP